MRLLNTKLSSEPWVREFSTDIPPYAILSHTWDNSEFTFQDINKKLQHKLSGFLKVQGACKHARKYDFEWIWIDTCCIDKSSSAELSEAINSMYRYYEKSEVCYVYLADVSSTDDLGDFRKSKWFTRGWTLQELLAPSHVVFLNRSWVEIGTRWSLSATISSTTSIPTEVFEEGYSLDRFSIAQRMSWAASRETTRPEDVAYCLMGIFGVGMPPIYGEGGERAFMRLQQEIIKISDDRSIFAWTASQEEKGLVRGMLARSPYEFRDSGTIGKSEPRPGHKSSFSFNNNGLYLHLPLLNVHPDKSNIYLASLDCKMRGRDAEFVGIYLEDTGRGEYVRFFANLFAFISMKSLSSGTLLPREVVVKESLTKPLPDVTLFEFVRLRPRLSASAQEHLPDTSASPRSFLANLYRGLSSHLSTDKTAVLFANYWKNRGELAQNCDQWRLMSTILQWMLTDRFLDRIQVPCEHHGHFLVEFQRTSDRTVRILEINHISKDGLTIRDPTPTAESQWHDPHNVLFRHDGFQKFWESRISSRSESLSQYITIEAMELILKSDYMLEPTGENLIKTGTMTVIPDDQTRYGFKISSTYWDPVYVWLFIYDLSDLSIDIIYKPRNSQPCLQPRTGQLDIGYGSSRAMPRSFQIPPGVPADVSYLKVFVSTSFFDLSYITESPFIETSEKQMSKKKVAYPGGLLGTLIIPIIQQPITT
ncbi:hypothetical protein VKT23_013017 [Stygiomarasmius scandens]|uniref:Heterokaryon incompatibility domain-containing protein n=1 Tax=Marasmiellus scandens TaxID=2682957 RepID=A0ABR1J7M0_9AGAR